MPLQALRAARLRAPSELLIWSTESGFEAPCPTSAPELALPSDATNWILRTPQGHAWFLDEASELEPIVAGGDYIQCARRYLVLDDVSQQEVFATHDGGETWLQAGQAALSIDCPTIEQCFSAYGGVIYRKPKD